VSVAAPRPAGGVLNGGALNGKFAGGEFTGEQKRVRPEAREEQHDGQQESGGGNHEGSRNRRQAEGLPHGRAGLDQVGSSYGTHRDSPHDSGQCPAAVFGVRKVDGGKACLQAGGSAHADANRPEDQQDEHAGDHGQHDQYGAGEGGGKSRDLADAAAPAVRQRSKRQCCHGGAQGHDGGHGPRPDAGT
jgi:hypothetical protein